MEVKKMFRKRILNRRKQLTQATIHKWNSVIYHSLFTQEEWNSASVIGITISTNNEINTRPIIEEAWLNNKKVAVPKSDAKTKQMTFYEITTFEQLKEGYSNILEPNEELTEYVSPEKIDLLIVPGVVFDKKGYRIGYGGGFFDRYLNDFKGKTISLAYDFQVLTELIVDNYDLPVEKVITNQRIYKNEHA